MAENSKGSLMEQLPLDSLKNSAGEYGKSLVNSTLGKASGKVEGLSSKITDFGSGNSGKNDDGQAGKNKSDDEASGEGSDEGAGEDESEEGAKSKNPLKAVGRAFSWAKNKITGGDDEDEESDSDDSEGSGEESDGSESGPEAGGEESTGSGASGNKEQKVVNLVEWIDVGVPVTVAYNQWTQFEEWSDFMKKVENVEFQDQEEAGKLKFKGQAFLSHREWEATIKEMVPDDRIIWKSTGKKGHLDGSVTFHEYGPRLTRICIVVEYFPQGLFEKTGQIWRAVGRRVRVEMKRYVRHVMTTTILDPDAAEGWRAEIRDEEIVRTHDEVVEQEAQEADDHGSEDQSDDDQYEDEYEDGEEPAADTEEDDGEYEEAPDTDEEPEATEEDEAPEESNRK
ncbi:SRPBCC family protein [Arthrobacter sp. H14]|uniref:SRPBCC family protein n=1 Tax=Arthrobacter sp. H14 TaxID=1312959 RepID=UPI0006869977|nr:SRPBCC family protein [Arthrobacter sp. H14]